MKIAWDPVYAHPLPEGHRFPMLKYELIPEQLLHEGTITRENIFSPEKVEEKYILLSHDENYWQKLKKLTLDYQQVRRIGFPLSAQLVNREITIVQGTIDTTLYAMEYGVSLNCAGGTHHAGRNFGEGFCLLNDIAIASNYLLWHNLKKRIAIVDLDVHQGNGTADILQGNKNIFTFSMHGEKNFPLQKIKSSLDIPLHDNTGDETYLSILSDCLQLIKKQFDPDFVFFQSGVDILDTDKLGRLSVSKEGCKERDKIVFEFCKKNNIPLAVCMGGGYSEKIKDIVDAHCNTFRLASSIFFY